MTIHRDQSADAVHMFPRSLALDRVLFPPDDADDSLDALKVGLRASLVKTRPIYCNGWRKNGRPCGHKVAVVPGDEWDVVMTLGTAIECASCRKVARIRDFI